MHNPGDKIKRRQDTVEVSVDHLEVGAVCRFPLEDDQGQLLLGAGTAITQALIEGLHARGITELAVHAEDVDALRSKSSSRKKKASKPAPNASGVPKDRDIIQNEHPSKWPKGVPLKDNLVDRHGEPLDSSRREVLRGHVKLARDQFEQLRLDIEDKKSKTIAALADLSGAFAAAMVDDHDQTVGDVVVAGESLSLTDRSVKLGVLGMAVGTELGLDGPSILEIGNAGLLHDIGLYSMDPSLIVPGRGPLSEEEMWEYRKHPINSANALKEVSSVSHSVLLAIEQVHEQYDGSGYPFGIEGKRANIYARVLNVCDTYIRLTHGTSFRKALVPHDALGLILHEARFGLFDPQVIHAFLRVESLFPLGSRVAIQDGPNANVIRRPVDGYAAPVLETDDGERIDLQFEPEMRLQPICDPNRNQQRLTQAEMQALRWTPADELLLEPEPAL